MTILRSGSSKKYSENWSKVFGGKKKKAKSSKTTAKKSVSKPAKKKAELKLVLIKQPKVRNPQSVKKSWRQIEKWFKKHVPET